MPQHYMTPQQETAAISGQRPGMGDAFSLALSRLGGNLGNFSMADVIAGAGNVGNRLGNYSRSLATPFGMVRDSQIPPAAGTNIPAHQLPFGNISAVERDQRQRQLLDPRTHNPFSISQAEINLR